MIIAYTIFNFLVFFIAYKVYKTINNPISLYSIVWQVALTIHESGLIVFYKLSYFTWLIIIIVEILFACGCYMGNKIKFYNRPENDNSDDRIFKREIKKWIIITTIISGFAIVFNFFNVVMVYGFDLLGSLTDVYSDRVNNVIQLESIPYLGSFIYVALSLNGIYMKKYGFNALLLIPAFYYKVLYILILLSKFGSKFLLL